MKKTIGIFILTGIFLITTPALAGRRVQENNNIVDIASFTCGEFIAGLPTADQDDIGGMMLWLYGYLSGISGRKVLNWDVMDSFSNQLVDYCGNHSYEKMLDAARAVGIQ